MPLNMLKVIFNKDNFSPCLLMLLKDVLQDLDIVEIYVGWTKKLYTSLL